MNSSAVVQRNVIVAALPREWLLAAGITVIVTLLLQMPYALAYATARSGTKYTGLLVNVEDANYITIVQRGSQGAWQHSLRFTSEPDTPAFLYVFYLALGHAARGLNVDATTMWHLARGIFAFVASLIAFGFIGAFIPNPRWRFVAWLLAIFGAGFDWFAFPWETLEMTSATPVDLKMADAHFFSAALTFPHYLGSITLLMILFWCGLRLLTESLSWGKFAALVLFGAAANLGIALVYPFFVVLSCGVLAAYVLFLMVRVRKFLWRKGIQLALLILPVLPLVLYYQQMVSSSALLRVWAAQSETSSPNPLHYFLTYAPYIVLALWGLWRVGLGEPSQAQRRALLWIWLIVVALLVYAPLGTQRRFLQGIQIPLAILATFGLFEVALPRIRLTRWFQTWARRPNYSAAGLEQLLVICLVLVLSLSSVYQWVSAVALAVVAQPYPLFRPRAEVAAMDWLRGRADANDVILSAYYTGSYLPLRSGARVYIGHYYETVHFPEKARAAEKFFAADTSDGERAQFLAANRIAYVFYGPAERALGPVDLSGADYMRPVFADDGVVIFRTVQ